MLDICSIFARHLAKPFQQAPNKSQTNSKQISSKNRTNIEQQSGKHKQISKKRIEIIETSENLANSFNDNEIERINILEKKQKQIEELNLDYIANIYWLIEDCKKYGT